MFELFQCNKPMQIDNYQTIVEYVINLVCHLGQLFVCKWSLSFHLYRCHTFGIGSEACQELVLGVAALSNGRHVMVGNKDRLQEKVC